MVKPLQAEVAKLWAHVNRGGDATRRGGGGGKEDFRLGWREREQGGPGKGTAARKGERGEVELLEMEVKGLRAEVKEIKALFRGERGGGERKGSDGGAPG